MAPQYLNIEGAARMLVMSRHQVHKLVRRVQDPLPHRKLGKHLRFEEEKIYQWFLRQPGTDGEDIEI